ncbi:unnamed protein product [Staurois parvus]|uniref:Uncharacterized protein n=1 Tax=Staurois parvus TaxID=386267 RepID=A0ABN9BJ16_9NEOB|nr:unnamed protein product [Staurois parvus]
MYINGRTGALQERVAVYKHPPLAPPVRAPWDAQHRNLVPAVSSGTSIVAPDLCEVPIM